jgi:hypothetical protein
MPLDTRTGRRATLPKVRAALPDFSLRQSLTATIGLAVVVHAASVLVLDRSATDVTHSAPALAVGLVATGLEWRLRDRRR